MKISMIKENLAKVEEKISEACKKSGRRRDEVTLIAVSKTKPISMIKTAAEAGILEFGENKPQELVEKYENLPKNFHWHMIGHLQRNKVKYIIDKATMIHSLESLRLAETINREAQKYDLIMPVLVEVNIAKEDTKYGLPEEETLPFIEKISKLTNIKVEGLMTIAPFTRNPEENRIFFEKLRKLYVDIKRKNIDNVNMCNLSMGMTGDYQIAIEEGANMVRVGTGIFGERYYNI